MEYSDCKDCANIKWSPIDDFSCHVVNKPLKDIDICPMQKSDKTIKIGKST